jgi:hypothetical protein
MVLKVYNHLYIKLATCLTEYLLKSLPVLNFFAAERNKARR